MAKILLDISRLAGRDRDRPPSGIDRMEYAYLCHFLNQPRQLIGFFTIRGNKFRRLTWENAVAKRDEIAADWIDRVDPDLHRRLRRFSPLMDRFVRAGERLMGETVLPVPDVQGRSMFKRGSPSSILLSVSHGGIDKTELWENLKRRLNARLAVYLHDLIPYHHPEFSREGEDRRHLARLATMIGTADLVLTNSQVTAREFRAFCSQNDKTPPPVKVLPLGVAPLFREIEPMPADADVPWFIMIGTIEPRKNHYLLLTLWRRLHTLLGDRTPKLILVGRRGWEIENTERFLDRCTDLKDCVVELPSLSDAQLAELLRRSRALLFPSFTEGYGLPIAEALTVGVPVICSDIAAFREVGGDIPDFIDPLDGPRWMETILDYASEQSVARQAQVERLKAYTPPTWERHFALLEAALTRHCSLDVTGLPAAASPAASAEGAAHLQGE
ncbi:glycosyltransferase family 4 protein [Zavarzinia aquatilis]|uniref:Glycosyltransferase family 1 protein n=1 Tax=Zavarzinia aquatilis TaxID=2211142 RepID=A0A317E780_9PROT|nr:glycosyltransferase family 1 protein [Zavarzinia aquatilis]PWR21263.1 glycosyltransferase family 1 protein [Zavarzinia aquatilis]